MTMSIQKTAYSMWAVAFGNSKTNLLYPGHIGLGNRPQMYIIFGNELNLWTGFILIMGRLGKVISLPWPYY